MLIYPISEFKQWGYISYAASTGTIPINLMGVMTSIKFNRSHTVKSPCTLLEIHVLDIN